MNPLLTAPHQPDPYALYAQLRAAHPTGLHHDAELKLWVASSAAAVEAVLRHPALRVRPPAEPVPASVADTPSGALFGGLMRQNDGPVHQRGKAWATAFLQRDWPIGDAVRTVVREGARPAVAPLNALLFEAPVRVLWALVHGGEAGELPGDVRAVIASWSPTADAATRSAGSDAATRLLARCEGDANRVGLFTQTCEATAGLMGAVLVALQREPGLLARWLADPALDEALALEVARHDPPVQNTRRFAADDGEVHGRRVQAGDAILVLLASANRDPAANPEPERFDLHRTHPRCFTWGLGGHACPGAALSRGIAMALLRAWHDDDAVRLDTITRRWHHRPSPNGRLAQFDAAA
ncbi:cytochrome P450 [Piscinibacter sp. HJYY11]|uniref:cytochrome P450 n=1 Tax=Piscinibacter sp. HJYY11 TaxID=2801333 RepID=UPI00191F5898|nr:cytochrome P450 [Piscinibacter sp. HJYY11]MBL0729118.1 cytochrome P450 [Piscinibacter sp. HJYY11]